MDRGGRPAAFPPPSNLGSFQPTLGDIHQADQALKAIFAEADRQLLVLDEAEYRLAYDKAGGFYAYSVRLPVKGGYLALRIFCEQVLLTLPYASLDEISFKRRAAGETDLDARLHFTLYLAGPPDYAAGIAANGREGGAMKLRNLLLFGSLAVSAGAVQRHAAEQELLAVGLEFHEALKSYAHANVGGGAAAPHGLGDLVRDPRYANPKRHLRRIPADPLSGQVSWGIILGPYGQGIVGIHSLSKDRPIKIANFPLIFQGFEAKRSYADWIFTASPE